MATHLKMRACLISVLGAFALYADEPKVLAQSMEAAWRVTWQRFYSPDSSLLYDYLSSYAERHALDHLPTRREIEANIPNPMGYGTGMEDGMISAGIMLSAIVDRYAVTGDNLLREKADALLRGIRACTVEHGATGFVARAVSRDLPRVAYINASRDQVSHAVHGLWLYARSPLCTEPSRREIVVLVRAIADRMLRLVTPENNYDFLTLRGTRDPKAHSTMWNVHGHEAARLPMIYAVAWSLTQDARYKTAYEQYADAAIEQSKAFDPKQPMWALLQMQGSLEVLLALETNAVRRAAIQTTMQAVTACCAKRAKGPDARAATLDLTLLATDWRTGGGLNATYRPAWYCIRESGEIFLTELTDMATPFPEEQQRLLIRAIERLDFNRVSSCGIFFLQAAYWKWQLRLKEGR